MNGPESRTPQFTASLGCLSVFLALLFLGVLMTLLVDVMQAALERLHLPPTMALLALLALLGIFVGGLVNVPVWRIERDELQKIEWMAVFGLWGFAPRFRRVRRDTLIAVNLGGCVIPSLLVAWQLVHLSRAGIATLVPMAVVVITSTVVCYRIAKPVPGIGIIVPGLVPPLVAVGLTWALLPAVSPDRAPVAFVAGVLGPLIGADLLHLKDISSVSVGVLSIGGAGTFDGIVLSGVLASLLA